MKVRLALLTAFVVLIGPAAASAAVTATERPAAGDQLADYWTEARMESAIPLDVAAPGAGLASAGDPSAAEPARKAGIRAKQVNENAPQNRAHGKVFFTLQGTAYECSGTVVKSKTRSTVWTAGHCVEEGRNGGFARRWIFVPAYSDGEAPYGQWAARKLGTTPGWARNGDLSYDVGAAKVQRLQGKRIAAVAGDRGIRFGGEPPGRIDALGYPARANSGTGQRFDGERGWRCDAEKTGRDRAGFGPKAIRIGCDMTVGASGGGWLNPAGKLISVTSYTLAREGTANRSLFGPALGSAARKLLKSISR